MTRIFAACLVTAAALVSARLVTAAARVAACLVTAAALVAAPQAVADPDQLVSYCSGDQTPMDTSCRPMPHQVFTEDALGANPNVPLGTNPGEQPLTYRSVAS
jgi:predicted component of type VI protein secretion system